VDEHGRVLWSSSLAAGDGDDPKAARQFLSELLARTDALMGASTGAPTTAAAAVAPT
jgi:hypothetical protein